MEIYDATEILQMESDQLKLATVKESADKCRLCLNSIKKCKFITNEIKMNFMNLTQLELLDNDKLSKFICSKCEKELKDANFYREKLIKIQKKLIEDVKELPLMITEVVHIKHEFDEENSCDNFMDDYSDFDDHDFVPQNNSDDENLASIKAQIKDFNQKQENKKTRSKKSAEDESQDDDDGNAGSEKRKKGKRSRMYDYYDPELDKEVQESKVKETNGKTYFLCSYCGKNMSTAFSLKEHILTKHRNLEKKFHCKYEGCGLSYVTESRLHIHYLFHKYTKQVVCPTCGKMQTSKSRLREHMLSVHEKVARYSCDICGYSGLLKGRIRAHVKTHIQKENRRNFPCHICGFISVCPKYLKRHISDHDFKIGIKNEEQGLVCHCGKIFKHKPALQMHIRCVHNKVKKHVCSVCGHAFANKVDLENHVLVKHNREKLVKNMPCDICGKLFGIEKQLARHRLYHFIKFECKVEGCDEYFNTAKRLQRHIKNKHKELNVDTPKSTKSRQRKKKSEISIFGN